MTLPTHYSLAEAAARFFAGGKVTSRSLYTEIRKGRLRAALVAGKYVITEDDIRAMIEACRCPAAAASRPASTSAPGRDASPSGSSSTADASTPRAAAEMMIRELKHRSRRTSPAHGPQRPARRA